VRFLSVVPRSEEQRFGIVLATALCLIAVSNIFKGADRLISGSLFAGSALAIVITIGYPELLRPLYRGWQRLGRILGLIVSPIVLGLIFFGMYDFIRVLWCLLRVRKKTWLAPVIIIMVVVAGLLILAQGSVLAPFIYALF
jgi:hypothetical protein